MEKALRLNLGAGIDLQPGFTNIDLYELKDLKAKKGVLNKAKVRGKYLKADVRKLPFEDESVDYIMASEILEHIPLKDLNDTLREWVRVLKKGGKMIITVPDFDEVAREWIEMSMEKYNPERYGEIAQVIYGNQITEGEFHTAPLNVAFFQNSLGRMGLKDGKIMTYKRGTPTINYPGKPAKKGFMYRNGVIHVSITK
jgi:predicted SAM-dependent methyltransferase